MFEYGGARLITERWKVQPVAPPLILDGASGRLFMDKRFSLLSDELAVEMSILSNGAWKLFCLFLQKIVRKRGTREPIGGSNPFKLTYQDFKKYGIAESSFKSGVKELVDGGFICVIGRYGKKRCYLLKW